MKNPRWGTHTLIQKWCTPIRFYNIRMISNQKGKTKYQLERDLVNHVSALKSESKLFQQRVVIGHFIHWLLLSSQSYKRNQDTELYSDFRGSDPLVQLWFSRLWIL